MILCRCLQGCVGPILGRTKKIFGKSWGQLGGYGMTHGV